MLRVLEFCTDFPESGGIQTHVLDLTRWLQGRGHHVRLAGQPGQSANRQTHPDFLELPMWKISVSHEQYGSLTRAANLVKAALKLRQSLRENPVDIIHCHETAPALTAWLATRGMNVPIIMTYHGAAPERVPQVARVAMRCAALTISPSTTSLRDLIDAGLDPKRALQAGLGVKPLPSIDPNDVTNLRKSYGLRPKAPLIFSPSRLSYQKGLDIMIDVAAKVLARHHDAVFVVAGAGPLDGEVQAWAQKAGMADAFRFIGSIETVPLHLAACDMVLLTSRWENLPISIVEAFRCARPVVATDCGGVGELVDDQVGFLCPVGDVEALSDAVNSLLDSPELCKAKGHAALERSREARFDPDAVHTEFEKLYEDLARGASRK